MSESNKSEMWVAGFVKVSDWCEVMSSIFSMELPWHSLRSKLAKLNSAGLVDYQSTFDDFKLHLKHHPEVRTTSFALLWRCILQSHVINVQDHSGFCVIKGKGKGKCIAVLWNFTTPLREITYHMGSHSVTCHPAEVTFPKGYKAELT